MPIYEYVCDACGHQLEVIQKFSDEPLKLCPECDEETLRKKVSAAAFRLKGGGWYETDFKSGDKKNLAGDTAKADSGSGSTESASKSESKAEGKAESKSDSKSESKSGSSDTKTSKSDNKSKNESSSPKSAT